MHSKDKATEAKSSLTDMERKPQKPKNNFQRLFDCGNKLFNLALFLDAQIFICKNPQIVNTILAIFFV